MVKNFEYIDCDGLQRNIKLSDDSYFILKYEAEFEEPLQEGLQSQSVDSALKLAFAMDVTDNKESYEDWVKSLKLPIKKLAKLSDLVTDLISLEEDSEKN